MKTLSALIQTPKESLKEIIREQKFSYACFGYAFGIISLYFAIKLGNQNSASFISFFFAFIFWFISNVILNFVLAALCNIFLEITGNKSSAVGIFILLGLSQIVWTSLIPCFMIARALPQIMPLTSLAVLGIIILQIYFVLQAIKHLYGISSVSSLIAFIISFILPFVASFCFFIFMVGLLISLFA